MARIIVTLQFCILAAAGRPAPVTIPASLPLDSPAQPYQESTAKPSKPEKDAGYILGAGDQISVHVVGLDEINDKPTPVDLSGYIRLPLLGVLHVAGLTITQLEAQLTTSLRTYMLHPDVSISVSEFRSQPVSVIGAVRNPGIQQVQGRKTLLEMLSLAGGIDNVNAGSRVKITRRLEWGAIPVPGAKEDPTHQFSVAELSLKSLLSAKDPQNNILIKPNDVVSIPRADTVYVIGEVLKSGGFVLNDTEDVTVLQALSMAGGLDKYAHPQDAKLLRRSPGAAERTEIPVDLRKVLDGRTPDIPMQPEDILFVPNNVPKRAAIRALEAGVQMGTGIVIWRRP